MTEKHSHSDIFLMSKNPEKNELKTLEDAFWEYYPHEVTWSEFKEINPDLFFAVAKIGRFLVQNGKLKPAYMP